ncbi:hypothetical protein OG21DRAFT_1514495 [Imleria badia]|nr:hypothetical protein OG21DRAFT_1514495 [Imleria badia]
MHHALEIPEILLSIFQHCCSSAKWRDDISDLVSLAGTCRAFKQPALDVLWEELDDLSPLAQCLPEASRQSRKYSFSRPLTQTEWNILRSYTCRIQSIQDFNGGLDQKSLTILSNPPTTELLFPNLRYLHYKYSLRTQTINLLHLPLPSLISLNVNCENPRWFQDSLESFSEFSPNIRKFSLYVGQSDVAFSKLVSRCICRWRNLQTVICPLISLDVDTLVHLSCMPALTQLHLALSATLPVSDSPLFFSNLHHMTSRSKSLEAITRLLSQIRLPTIMNFTAIIPGCPSIQELSSFLVGIWASSAGYTIERLTLYQLSPLPSNNIRSEAPLLGLEDLWQCTAFSSLRHLQLDIEWNVGLADSELLALTSAWPHLEHLSINVDLGWNTPGGITPNGLLQLLQKCPSLNDIALAIDTRGYTELPSSGLLASLGLTLPRTIYLNVLDSIIEAESVPAIAAFFACTPRSQFCFHAWLGRELVKPPGWKAYGCRWMDVSRRAANAVGLGS